MREWWEICELGWGRSWLKAKAEAWVHSKPRVPCVPGELTWNHWSCLQLSVKQVLEALIQKSTSADFKRKFNQKVFIFRMMWSSGMKALLEGDVSTALYRARALHNNTQGACSNPSWNPQELYCCLQISTGSSTPAQEISVDTVCSICPMWPLHTYGPTGQWTCSSYIFTFICIKVQWLYVWDFQILSSVLGLLLRMSGNLGQMAKTPDLGEKCQTVWFLREVWTDMERRSGVVWAVQAGGRGITPRGTLGKSSPCSGKSGWQKQKVFVRRYG